ncbi:hypothetical protein HRbin08_01886 [bacterium HR08]|nr:hypothetical protein HRbin08_01886 [bacterium HR08]
MIRQVARVRRIIGQEGELHSRFVQVLRGREDAVVGIVLVSGEAENRTEQHGDVLLFEHGRDLRRVERTAQDDLDFLLLREFDGRFDVPRLVGRDDQRQRPLDDRNQRLQDGVDQEGVPIPIIGGVPLRRAHLRRSLRLRIGARILQKPPHALQALVALATSFFKTALARLERLWIEEATRRDGGKVEIDPHGRLDEHLLPRPAVEVDERGLSGEDAAARRREHGRDAVDARHRDDLARGVNGDDRSQVGIKVPDLIDVHGGGDLTDLGQADGCSRINESGIDPHPLRIDDARARRDRDVPPDGGDLPVADDHRAALDHRPGDRDDARVGDGIGLPALRPRVRSRERQQKSKNDDERKGSPPHGRTSQDSLPADAICSLTVVPADVRDARCDARRLVRAP